MSCPKCRQATDLSPAADEHYDISSEAGSSLRSTSSSTICLRWPTPSSMLMRTATCASTHLLRRRAALASGTSSTADCVEGSAKQGAVWGCYNMCISLQLWQLPMPRLLAKPQQAGEQADLVKDSEGKGAVEAGHSLAFLV